MLLIVSDFAIVSGYLTAMVVFVGGLLWYRLQEKKRRQGEMEALAQRLELSFTEKDDFGLVHQLQHFELFERERNRYLGRGKISNVLRGQAGDVAVYLFDYSYVVNTGKSSHTVSQTVFFADHKGWSLPDFRLRPEGWWQKMKLALGMEQDINFPDEPEFSGRFWLKGQFEQLVREKFGPELRNYLTERPPAHLEGRNYYLIAYKPRKKLNADEAEVFYEHCLRLTELLQSNDKGELLDLADKKVAVEVPEPLKRNE